MGILYIVATPIGNLEDITLRALRTLREVALIAAEDTRTSGVLLHHFQIPTPLTSYHDHNQAYKTEHILSALATGDVALISDAGMPAISDPGYELVKIALERGFRVVPIPGASAVVTALVASGLPTDSFTYVGFLPKKTTALQTFLTQFKAEPRTLVMYESPHRLAKTLEVIVTVFGAERPVCVAREMTKLHEEFFRGTAQTVLERYRSENPKGEITLLIGGAPPDNSVWDEERVRAAFEARLEAGEARSAAAKAVAAESGWRKSEVYELDV